MSKLLLPKGYLSYSAIDLWNRDPEGYRRRYYVGEPSFSTPYTTFGNVVGEALEFRQWDNPVLAPVRGKVPQGTHPEHEMAVEVGGVPIFGKLDDFDLQTFAIEEYKTGIQNKKTGKDPWDIVKVHRHVQLPFYSLLVRTKYGEYNPNIQLTWLETKWSTIKEVQRFGKKEFETSHVGLKLTGKVEVFQRELEDWELDHIEEMIIRTAQEISKDYKAWKKKNK